ncbi:MAG: hypothetical protein E3J46_11880 [Desulfobacteraceae bacterium]|nr:MAG: hypothetical protein E3J46_11880 [Desulfobacteraceae bacterium]
MMKIMKFGLVIMMNVIFFFSISAHSLAQKVDSEKEEKRYRLDKVIVRDHPLREEPMVVTPDVTVINVEKFQKAGPVQNIRDILSEALGLNVQSISGTPSPSESIYIRGLDQSRIQVFMDGRPMRLFGAYGYYKVDWTTMPLDNVETIEIIRGSHSLLYPFSMGGAINIITKKGIKTDEIKPKVSVTTEFGSYHAQSYSASVLGGLANTIGYSFAAARRKGDGYLRNNYYDTDSFNARISFYLPTGGTLSGGWDYVDNTTGYAVINDPSRADFDPDYPTVREDEIDWFTHGIEGRTYPGGDSYWQKRTNEFCILFEQPLGPGDVRAQVYQHKSSRDRYGIKSDGTQKISGVNIEEVNWGYGLDYLDFELISKHAFSIGGDYRTQGRPDNKNYYRIMSGYFQDVWSITAPLTLTWGARWYEFQSDAYRPYEKKADRVKYRRKETELCPKIRLDYEFDPGLSLYAAVSREMRTP